MTEEIRLVIPAEEGFRPVAHLVAGGVALRLDLTYDDLEDVQVALEALLGLREGGDVVVELGTDGRALHASVGPLPDESLRDLDEERAGLGLRRVLETVCDSFEVEQREDGAWIELTKRAAAAREAG
jgi:anti-sigma regulatory factor (Ser/Thr protein kinase)